MNNLHLLEEIINSPLITPYNLMYYFLEEDYNEISFKKNKDTIITNILMTKNNQEVEMFYIFDLKYNLNEIYQEYDGKKEIIFNRKSEAKRIIKNINNSKIKKAI